MRLDGIVAVVTGGTGNIGSAVAESLSAAGARVVKWDVLVEEQDGSGAVACDVSDPGAVSAAYDKTIARYGVPGVLVNAAGVTGGRSPWVEDVDDDAGWAGVLGAAESWEAVFGVNVMGVVNTNREFARRAANAGQGGAIVNITSIMAEYLFDPTLVTYSASKAAVHSVTRAAARAFGPLSIRVNAVAPGAMDTRTRLSGTSGPLHNARHDSEGRIERIKDATPLGRRRVSAHDIAQAVMGVLGSDFLTGQILAVDGGLTLRLLS